MNDLASSRASHDAPIDAVSDAIASAMSSLQPGLPVVVAFSGGLDSSVLLNACQAWSTAHPASRIEVLACHVHHGLQAAAEGFLDHCRIECARLGVRLIPKHASGKPARGESLEAWAREQRYRVLADCARESGAQAVMLAHHADDQAETLLIGLSRGSGIDGLAGMGARGARAEVLMVRPLLNVRRAALQASAKRWSLSVIDDPMNEDPAFLRSALRTRVMPVLEAVSPSFVSGAARSAGLLAEAAQLLAELGRDDLAAASEGAAVLRLEPLASLSRARQANVLRHWLAAQGAPMPSQARLAVLLEQSFDSRSAHALWRHAAWWVVRYRERLQVIGPDAWLKPDRVPSEARFEWTGAAPIEAAEWGLVIQIEPSTPSATDFDIDRALLESGGIMLREAPAGLRIRPGPRAHSRTLRKRWQEAGVPPWLRAWLPEVSVGDRVLGVPGLGLADAETAQAASGRVRFGVRLRDPEDPRSSWVLPYN